MTLVLCTRFNVEIGALVTQANIEGFVLSPLSGDGRGYMPPLLKTKQDQESSDRWCFTVPIFPGRTSQ